MDTPARKKVKVNVGGLRVTGETAPVKSMDKPAKETKEDKGHASKS